MTEARGTLPPRVRLSTRRSDGAWRRALPANARVDDGVWSFVLPQGGVEPLLSGLVEGGAGIEALSIERPGLHDAFVRIVGETAEEGR